MAMLNNVKSPFGKTFESLVSPSTMVTTDAIRPSKKKTAFFRNSISCSSKFLLRRRKWSRQGHRRVGNRVSDAIRKNPTVTPNRSETSVTDPLGIYRGTTCDLLL